MSRRNPPPSAASKAQSSREMVASAGSLSATTGWILLAQAIGRLAGAELARTLPAATQTGAAEDSPADGRHSRPLQE
jgi:hypothetical protein